LKTVGYLPVTHNGSPLHEINELEYINGYIWGNVWHSKSIYQIEPQTGNVVREIDLSDLFYAEKKFE